MNMHLRIGRRGVQLRVGMCTKVVKFKKEKQSCEGLVDCGQVIGHNQELLQQVYILEFGLGKGFEFLDCIYGTSRFSHGYKCSS